MADQDSPIEIFKRANAAAFRAISGRDDADLTYGTDGAKGADFYQLSVRGAGFILTLATGCALATLHFKQGSMLPLDAGGILGNLVGANL